jgi:colicin import membrane protein
MNPPSLWTSLFWALLIHILIGAGFSIYASRALRVQMPEVYRVTIVSPPHKARPDSLVTQKKKPGRAPSKAISKKQKTTPLRKGVTMLKKIEKSKKEKTKKRKRHLESKKAYKEEKALEEALKRIHTEKIAQIKKRLQLKKSVLSAIEALPSRTGMPASRDVQNYAAQVRQLVRAEWVFPGALAQRPYLVEVRFRVKPNGEVVGISVIKSSGSSLFDASVVKAIKKASPLPPPPPGGEEITIRFRTGAKGEG